MKTRRIVPVLMAAALLLVLFSPALAEEEASYNFASAQGNKQLKAVPGQETEGVIYFYNIEGNRITHISLEVSQAPDNWKVEIDPPQHEIQVDVSGRIVAITENLYIEPSEAMTEEPEEVPEGMVCIKLGEMMYALAKAVHITIQVPETAEIGTEGDIVIAAEASWLGQSGAAAIKQARRFDFFVEVTSGETEYRETIIGEVEKAEGEIPQAVPAAEPGAAPATQPATEEGGPSANIFMRWLPVIVAAAVVIVAAILLVIIRRRGKAKG